MFTDAKGNFEEAWSRLSTIQFLRLSTILNRVNRSWDAEAMGNIRVFIQNPNYNVEVTTPARNADWGNPNQPEASRITLEMNQRSRVEDMLYVEDMVENPIKDYDARLRQFAMNAMVQQYEDNVIAYMLRLATSGARTVNGNAGPIGLINYASGTEGGTGFDPSTGKPVGTSAQREATRKWLLSFLTDARVRFERQNIHIQGSNTTIGGMAMGAWCLLPIELFVYGIADALEDKGFDLPWMTAILRDLGVFGMALAGHYRGFDLIITNALTQPANAAGSWYAIAGSNAAVAAPARPFRNYIRTPENAQAERYEFRQNQTYGRALVNSQLMIRGQFNAGASVMLDDSDGASPTPDTGPTTAADVVAQLAQLVQSATGAHDLRSAAANEGAAPEAVDAAVAERQAQSDPEQAAAEADALKDAEQAAAAAKPKPRARTRKS